MRHEVEVTCPADAIPEFFEFNLEGLEIGRSIHISAVKMPEGVRPTIQNRDFTVATIAGHKIEEEPTPGAEAATAEGAAPAEVPKARHRLPKAADAKAAAAGPRQPPAARRPAGARRLPSRRRRPSPPTGQEIGAAVVSDAASRLHGR